MPLSKAINSRCTRWTVITVGHVCVEKNASTIKLQQSTKLFYLQSAQSCAHSAVFGAEHHWMLTQEVVLKEYTTSPDAAWKFCLTKTVAKHLKWLKTMKIVCLKFKAKKQKSSLAKVSKNTYPKTWKNTQQNLYYIQTSYLCYKVHHVKLF